MAMMIRDVGGTSLAFAMAVPSALVVLTCVAPFSTGMIDRVWKMQSGSSKS